MKKIIPLSIFTLISFLSESFAMDLIKGEEGHALPLQIARFSLEGDSDVQDFLPGVATMMCVDSDCAPPEQYVTQQTPTHDEPVNKMSCYGFVPQRQESYGTLYFGDANPENSCPLLVSPIVSQRAPQSEPPQETTPTAVGPIPVKTGALQEVTNRAFKNLCERGPLYPVSLAEDSNKENSQPITSGPNFYLWETSLRPLERTSSFYFQ